MTIFTIKMHVVTDTSDEREYRLGYVNSEAEADEIVYRLFDLYENARKVADENGERLCTLTVGGVSYSVTNMIGFVAEPFVPMPSLSDAMILGTEGTELSCVD